MLLHLLLFQLNLPVRANLISLSALAENFTSAKPKFHRGVSHDFTKILLFALASLKEGVKAAAEISL